MPKIKINTCKAPRNTGFAFTTGGYISNNARGSRWFFYLPQICVIVTREWAR